MPNDRTARRVPRGIRRGLGFVVVAVFGVLYTALALAHSFQHGRLAGFPINDDVYYFDEGLRALLDIRENGIRAFPAYLLRNPPHGPLSSLVCTAAFATVGIRDWAPYAASGGLVILLLALVNHLRSRYALDGFSTACLGAVALAAPLTLNSVIVYQPVFPAALATALGSAAYLDGWPASNSRSCRIASAALWIVALLAKPTTSPLIVLTLLAATLLSAGVLSHLRAYLSNIAVIAVIVTPYYVAAAPDLVHYIWVGTAKSLVRYEGSSSQQLAYYLTGPSGGPLLGSFLWFAVPACTASAIVLARTHAKKEMRLFAGLCFLAVLNYAILTASIHKHEHLGPPFQYFVLVLALAASAHLLSAVRNPTARMAALIATAGVVAACWPVSRDQITEAQWRQRKAGFSLLLDRLYAGSAGPRERVFLTSAGYLSVNALWYQFVKSGRSSPRIEDLALLDALDDYRARIAAADWVIAAEPGNADVAAFLPSTRVIAQTLEIARGDAGLKAIARIPSGSGGGYWLFHRARSPVLLSKLVFGDPASAAQILNGCYASEGTGWRWCERRFGVVLRWPEGASAVSLVTDVFVPEGIVRRFGRVTLQAKVAGQNLPSKTLDRPGVQTYKTPLSRSTNPVEIHFRTDNALPPDAVDRRERAIVVLSIGLEPQQ